MAIVNCLCDSCPGDMRKDGGAETTGGHDRRDRKNFLRVKLKKKKKKKKRKKRSQSGERWNKR